MFIDTQLLFSSAQALTATADATNVIDASVARNLGDGMGLSVYVQVNVAADFTTTDETYTFRITTDDNAALSSDTVLLSQTILATALTLNSLHEIRMPSNLVFERHVGLVYTLAGTTPSVTVTAWLAQSRSLPSVRSYANGYDV